ncbi:MAG: transposase [Candidatus Bipolaricaulis sp.]|nr:transposase [Candidatus Bipolaricaulis sp.]
MKGKRYTEEQIVRILREVESGTPILEACRKPKSIAGGASTEGWTRLSCTA